MVYYIAQRGHYVNTDAICRNTELLLKNKRLRLLKIICYIKGEGGEG